MATRLTPEEKAAILRWPRVEGVPILAHNSTTKECHVPGWSTINLENENFEENLANGLYDAGVSVRTGATLLACRAKYLIGLDYDGEDAVAARFGTTNFDEIIEIINQEDTLIEWHEDDKYRLHQFYLSDEPIKSKVIEIGNSQLEVRCINDEGNGSLLIVSPSIHLHGKQFKRLGKPERIKQLNDTGFMELVSDIEFILGIYTPDDNRDEYTRLCEDPAYYTKLGVGDGRHPAMKRIALVYFYRDNDTWRHMSDNQRKAALEEWNKKLAVPKTQKQVDSIWNWVVKHHKERRDEQHAKNKTQHSSERVAQKKKQLSFLDYLRQKYHFKTTRDNEEIFYYDSTRGIYRPNAEPIIEEELFKAFGDELTNKDVSEDIGRIRRSAWIDRSQFNSQIVWIATKNCMVNLATGQSRAFSPDFMCTY